jgi:site-specific DNA-methyltransferase (adenine-specific)
LKPMYEPIVLARRPFDPTTPATLDNVARHGSGALNIDAARIARPAGESNVDGFWPSNVALSHEPGCGRATCRSECSVRLIDQIAARERQPGAPPFSRLFYTAKTSRAEREAGCEQLEARVSPIFSRGSGTPRRRANLHPTVKPIDLMRWLVRLVVPSGGVVLDPFAGSGSTGIAAVLEGRQFVGIEREPSTSRSREPVLPTGLSGPRRRRCERRAAMRRGAGWPRGGRKEHQLFLPAANAIQPKEVSSHDEGAADV